MGGGRVTELSVTDRVSTTDRQFMAHRKIRRSLLTFQKLTSSSASLVAPHDQQPAPSPRWRAGRHNAPAHASDPPRSGLRCPIYNGVYKGLSLADRIKSGGTNADRDRFALSYGPFPTA
jgi:hypothetical protein